jgi:hypothetical protein
MPAPWLGQRSAKPSLAVLALCCCAAARAGPPFVTDDPEPVALHHAEINLAFQQTRSDAQRSGTLSADMNFGCAQELQCHVAISAAFASSSGAGLYSGLGDVELGVKYRFLNQGDRGLMAAVYPTVFLPTGAASRGLGNGRAQVLLPVWLQKSLGRWTWDAGVSYLYNPAPDARSSWYVGLLSQRAVNDRLKIGAELFHRTPVADNAPATSGFNVGAVVKLSESGNLLVSIGRGLQAASANRSSVYLAYQLEL